MECYQQPRTASISRVIPVYHTGWQVQADQEDGAVKMRILITITILFSSLFSQSIIGSWELTSPYTSEVDGKAHALIRHNYSANGDFDSYIWHDGRFRLAGNGEYYIYKNRLSQTVNRETYAGIMDFTTDSTMTVQWDGETAALIFKRLPKKPQS